MSPLIPTGIAVLAPKEESEQRKIQIQRLLKRNFWGLGNLESLFIF